MALLMRHAAGRQGAWLTVVLAAGWWMQPEKAGGQDGLRQAALVLRILSYDRNLEARLRSEQVNVLVVYRRGLPSSEDERDRMVRGIRQLARRSTVANRQARAVPHSFTSKEALARAARSAGAAGAYICQGLSAMIPAIAEATRTTKVLSMSASRTSARRGLSVALVPQRRGVKLIVNLRAARAEGARLDANVLDLAERVGE